MASPEKHTTQRDRTMDVHFVCQRCSQPLKLHPSFGYLDDQALSDLSVPTTLSSMNDEGQGFVQEFQKCIESSDDDVSRKIILPVKLTETGSGFTVVGESLKQDVRNVSGHSLFVTAALFDVLSDQSDVDHPLCEECTDNLLDQMDLQLKIADDECKEYSDFLEKLNAESNEDELEKLQVELEELKNEEESLQKELREIEVKESDAKEMLKICQDEQEKLQREESRYWHEYSVLKRQLLLCEDEQQSVNNQLHYAEAQLNKLTKTNIFNATFFIWHSGHFGTINNFRLGRLPSVPVDWSEINAAWGQTALLLHSLAKKIGLTFKRYRLVPYGNNSYLESIDDKAKELPLYCSGGLRYLWDTKFDQAMVAFLDCFQQFNDSIESNVKDSSFHLPYRMENGKIIDASNGSSYSIKIQFNSEEQWTKALKFMLTNLKWALAWVSTQRAS